ncbi:MAG TPA: hypothetical protein DEP45_13325 [Armatimonadetes bacterium]|nr:hypothetical protein [Armatimonadota bacterium]
MSCVFVVVLTLALAGSAHPFTVEIVQPTDDPCLLSTETSHAFAAVAFDSELQDITEQVTWSWDFGDASGSDSDNPTEHAFEVPGDYTVTVTAAWSAQQAQDQLAVDAQEPTGALVVARQVGVDTYVTVDTDEVCHARYLIARDAYMVGYEAVWFQHKYEWEPRFDTGVLYYTPELITLDGKPIWGWIHEWHTDECPGQATAGTFNGGTTWKVTGAYEDPWTMAWVLQLIGEPTCSVNNTVVSSSGGVLLYDPENEYLDECLIPWTTSHLEAYDIGFWVPITIYDLAGNLLYTHLEQGAPFGSGSWTWDGTIFAQEPEGPTQATKGFYTYTVGTVGELGYNHGVSCWCPSVGEGCARGDWDKSGFLTAGVDSFYYFSTDVLAGALRGVVKYTLSSPAGSVNLDFYGPNLSPIGQLTGQPTSAGTHWSGVYTLHAVDFDQDGDPIGPIYCVISATEGEADALQNRDRGVAKPALQKGTTALTCGLEILQPDGHPSVENDMVFDAVPAPGGGCTLAAQGTTHGLANDAELEWSLSPIMTQSVLTTVPDPAAGSSVSFTYSGLPASNSQFGPALVTLTHSDPILSGYADTEEIRVYYSGTARNHSGQGSNVTPNWYYYWREGSVVDDLSGYEFDYSPGDGYGSYHPLWGLSVHDAAPSLNEVFYVYHVDDPQHQEIIGSDVTGLDCCAATCAHELEHMANYGRCGGQQDSDGDGVPDVFEDATCVPGNYYLDKYNSDTYDIAGYLDDASYAAYGDDEFLARKAEQRPGQTNPDADWSDASTFGRNYP